MIFTVKNFLKVSTIMICIISSNTLDRYDKFQHLRNKLPVSSLESWYGKKFKLKDTSTVKPIRDISRIFFYEYISMQRMNAFAIDFVHKKMQENPHPLHFTEGPEEFDTNLSEDDVNFLFKLLEKSKITKWDKIYDVNDPDLLESGEGYIWELAIQYNDGTVWYHLGRSYPKLPILPEGYKTLVEGLNALAERKRAVDF